MKVVSLVTDLGYIGPSENVPTMVHCHIFAALLQGLHQREDAPGLIGDILDDKRPIIGAVVALAAAILFFEFLPEMLKYLGAPAVRFVEAVLEDGTDSLLLSLYGFSRGIRVFVIADHPQDRLEILERIV